MANFIRNRNADLITCQSVDGRDVTVFIRHSDYLIANMPFPVAPFKAILGKVTNVSGASDGANAEVLVRWEHMLSSNVEVARVKESPAELRQIFNEAGYGDLFPQDIQKSFGHQLRRVANFFGARFDLKPS